MKKIILVAALAITAPSFAQEKFVVSAGVALKEGKLDEAKENIDKAMSNPETKDKPKALFIKAQTYLSLQLSDKYKASNPYREGVQATYKLIEAKADYEKETVDALLFGGGVLYYNDGVKAYNDKKYADAIECMKNVVKIHDIGVAGKRFSKLPPNMLKQMDTVAADAAQTVAMSTLNLGKTEEAIALLIAVKNNPITKSAQVYQSILYAYNTLKKTNELNAMIQEARTAYPDDATIRNYELNSAISSGKQDDLAKKLEEAIQKEPNNPDLLFNLATTYLSMASPKSGPKPSNYAELIAKSEDAYQRALKLQPDNASYNYNCGALYFNQATDYNDQMNAITGVSDADEKKYNELKEKRDGLFARATPYFEKAYTVLSGKDLSDEDKRTYKSSVLALKEVYARQNKMDKSEEMKKKYESL